MPRRIAIITSILFLAGLAQPGPGQAAQTPGRGTAPPKSRVWVYFTDHGESSARELRALLDRATIGDRARARRMRRSRFDGPDVHDLRVNARYVDAVRSSGAEIKHQSRYFNAVSAWVTVEQRRAIERLPFVSRTAPVRVARQAAPDSRPMLDNEAAPLRKTQRRAGGNDTDYGLSWRQQWQINTPALHEAGYHGEGIRIAMLDTGFFIYHTGLRHLNIIAQWDFINQDGVTGDQPGDDLGQMGHGTMALGLLASYWPGWVMGVAWEAEFVLAKTERLNEEIEAEEDDYVAALEWADDLGVDIVNSSLGYYEWYTYPDLDGDTAVTTRAVDIAASRGILVVTGAGNEGSFPWPTLLVPADADSAIAVGAADTVGVVTDWSSRGPTYDGRIKPDVLAPGQLTASLYWQNPFGPAVGTGTSAATPLVAGAAALILQQHPDWSPIRVRDALRATASHASDPDNNHGWGLIDASAASNYKEVLAVTVDVRPGACDNAFNPASHGLLPALLLGSPDLTVGDVDIASLRLAGAKAVRTTVVDMGGGNDNDCPRPSPDGFDDLLIKFDAAEAAAALDTPGKGEVATLHLTGQLVDGTPIEGEAQVRIVGRATLTPNSTQSTSKAEFALYQNAPNPFNPSTTLSFSLPRADRVRLAIYDVAGRVVATLLEEMRGPGRHAIVWEGRDGQGQPVASGVYFCRLEAGPHVETRRIILMK